MSRARDISIMLSKTEVDNTSNLILLNTSSEAAGGLDSAQVQNLGLQSFTTLDSLPSTGLVSGQQAWVESSGRLYISNGSGWYNVALINASPTLTLDQSGTIQLNGDTLSVTVTASASDSDDNQDIITFSVESDGNMVGTGTTVSQDSSVFTITALSADSGGTAGDFTLTFKATDQIAVDNETLSFSLTFSNVIDSSAETILLMKADGNNATNAAITHLDSDETSTGFTETGAPQASRFTPYRSGGYSTYFGGAADRIYTGSSADFDLDTNDWCYEGFFYVPSGHSFVSYPRLMGLGTYYNNASSFGVIPDDNDHSDYITVYWGDGGSNASRKLISSTTWDKGQWNHVAVVRKGGAIALYYNGTRIANNASYGAGTDIGSGNTYAFVGTTDNGSEGAQMYFRDVRLVNGSSIYDPADTTITVPTEALTAVTNTKLLVGATPYIADISSSAHALTQSGVDGTYPFSPYDYEPWAADDHGGSVYVDGSSYAVSTDAGDTTNLGTGDFTAELWFRRTGAVGNSFHDMIVSTRGDGLLEEGDFEFYVGPADDGVIGLQAHTGTNWSISGGVVRNNVWHHVAAVRNSGTITLYLDGVSIATRSDTGQFGGEDGLVLGGFGNGSYKSKGHISDIRFIAGTAVYTANFTPPTSLTTQAAGTKFLMQNKSDANVYDAAAANAFILKADTSSSTTQRKFTTSSSVYFDGTGDYIELLNSTGTHSMDLGSDEFTLEFWMYPTNVGTGHYVFGSKNNSLTESSGSLSMEILADGRMRFWVYTSASADFIGSATVSNNTWYHIALVRSDEGSTHYFRAYKDGVSVGNQSSTSSTTNLRTPQNNLHIGTSGLQGGSAEYFTGYIQDFRIIKGVCKYPSGTTFTPPTAEFEL